METMTQEEKAKAYDEAIERARKLYERGTITESLGHVFPELKESDDERVRKAMIDFFKHERKEGIAVLHYGVNIERMISWLEKQGEQKPTLPKWKYKKDNTPLLRDSLILNKYGCVAKSPSGAIVSDVWVLDYDELAKLPKEEIEKQGEQKPNKVEPKFHEGEWITNGNYTWKIVEVKPLDYILQSQEGNIVDDTISHVDEQFHSFTIEDAKDGDVLFYRGNVNYSDGIKFDRILLFENLDKSFFVLTKYSNGVEDYGIDVNIDYPNNIVLATKEQKEILFMAMKDAGYEFDFDKKELKKIEPFDKYEGFTDFERTLTDICIGWIGEELGWKQYIKDNADVLLKIAIKKFNLVQDAPFEQKPAWSEEDMSKVQRICKYLDEAKKYYADITEVRECINWLKSLKDRVLPQPKQEWSEEDEKVIHCFEYTVKHFYEDEGTIKWCCDWLNSLRPQNHWKPTEVHMRHLWLAAHGDTRANVNYLIDLYNDLKKLKGEQV